jgi:regulator of protease activity HflC (stomatin/prohibitin superfamily)
MSRQRRGKGNGSAAVALAEARREAVAVAEAERIKALAWGTEHDSIVKPPLKPRTLDQVRWSRRLRMPSVSWTPPRRA